jgi:hypothetical protein
MNKKDNIEARKALFIKKNLTFNLKIGKISNFLTLTLSLTLKLTLKIGLKNLY